VCAAAVFWASELHAAPAVLTLKNGDRVSGEVVSEDALRVVIRSPLFGRLKIWKDEIAQRVNPDEKPPVVSSTPTNAPPAASAPSTNAVAAAAPAAPAGTNAPAAAGLAKPGAVAAPIHPSDWAMLFPAWLRPFSTNWHGAIQLGLNLGFGTTEQRTFYSNASANHNWERVHNLAEFHSAYGIINNVESANRMDGALKTDVYVDTKRREYLYNQGGGGFDSVRHINLEYHEGVGAGYKVIQRKQLIVNFELGGQYQHYDYLNLDSKDLVSARVGEDLNWKPIDKLVITQRLAYLPNVANLDDYRIRFDLTAAYPLFGKVTINLNVIDTYDSRPVADVHNNDLQVQSTLGYTF
jgi:Protein of unknown function, DUF481